MNAATFISSPPYTLAGEVMNFSGDVIKKFGSKVDFVYLSDGEPDYDQCWEWRGTIGNKGYGQFKIGKKNYISHRVSYMITHPDEDISNLLICHSCDNPGCVNPEHLWSGTHMDNMIDRDNKGRTLYGDQCLLSVITEEQIRNILIDIYNNKYSSRKQITKDYKVSEQVISQVLTGRTWKQITSDQVKKLDISLKKLHDKVIGNFGERSHYAKLKKQDVVKIKKILSIGRESQRNIAKKFNVAQQTISSINSGNSWKNV